MLLTKRIGLNNFSTNRLVAISYNSKIVGYPAWPLTLVHFARAAAAVTHSMTEW